MSFLVFGKPDRARLERFLRTQRALPVSYGGSLTPTPGFNYKRTLKPLGSGAALFERAAAGLQAWAVYPAWLTLHPNHAPLREGEVVALATGVTLAWTLSAVRIVAVLRTPRRYSFTLGTLPQHAVTGLERFSVTLDDDGGVWYELEALSKPQHPLVRVGAPVLRLVQTRFAVDSARSLRRFIAGSV